MTIFKFIYTLFRELTYFLNLRFDTIYLLAKFDDSSFSHSRDITGAPKFKMGHVNTTTPIRRVFCHPYMLGLRT